jgi:anti-anti-sigma factor
MLKITEILNDREAILKISGMMVDADAMTLNDKVKSLVVQGTKNIVIDLSEVKLMNSCFGLGIITACWACVNRSGGNMTIANPSPKVSQLLKITKLDQILEIVDTAKRDR